MASFTYFTAGKKIAFTADKTLAFTAARPFRAGRMARSLEAQIEAADSLGRMIASTAATKAFSSIPTAGEVVANTDSAGNVTIATQTAILEGATLAAIHWMRDKHGFEVVQESTEDKILMCAPDEGLKGIEQTFKVTRELYNRGGVKAAHPNFVRMLRQVKRPLARAAPQWNLDNDGTVGEAGADVSAIEAWKITKGDPAIRVAVLDEGVDSHHPALNVVAEYDAVDRNSHARPNGNDAHGTACAGTIASRDPSIRGLAPNISLVGIRIAKDDGRGNWIFDDFSVADAIDWAWREEGGSVDVLSNSWGGGPPVDALTRAFDRARKRGRRGKGCVVVIAAGNDDGPVSYPGTLRNVLTVGASNQWDERKSPTSRDGEDWWGSNYGPSLDIMAPGVAIRTADISGAAGYTRGNFVDDFNGTSSATPHVAAAAAMILSVKPKLTEAVVRRLLIKTADRIGGIKRRDNYLGNGRLNIAAALAAAQKA